MATAPKSTYPDDPMEIYGAGLACAIFLYFLISYLSQTISTATMAAQLAVELANTNTPDLGDWYMKQFLLAYVEPGAGAVRKILFTSPMPIIVTCMVGGGLSWLFRKTGWLKFEGGWRFFIGLIVAFAALVMAIGDGNLLDYIISQFRGV